MVGVVVIPFGMGNWGKIVKKYVFRIRMLI
jgi:hypothetical protein